MKRNATLFRETREENFSLGKFFFGCSRNLEDERIVDNGQ